ncbi:exodeoxyribonuclease VII small subunit [Clostridium thermosuccinogenes]|jgi:exodeoxyribonuclease VII small subunit|uniref:Exodeoxyribonuclease 7 small subunit n=1 Tax=Clostridium thermosuccinogenes TaxID=84032 RepID=A0A2K2FJ02_9CLOT|nr:exodeoxyribonuclease VII small subunit [Pseudoclostridium thermosuccinogenes]AUS96170.1 exodeoxyribonuclease VII small subunit [Pseudoclostridium thermosuccinogenes]PNT93147.1 exodeoxyribonuclease VII small subunit [Pseudoclostridium thermosuccinogenes]PNT98750.1 exodeoxyribonuclease VII small subunit [Pseudoclostridium thermosuccinogenes]PNU00749.1 exodeoxyribonuclease VII small subunit [Pseudoclostridium thermosuccinogenes]
MSKKEKKFEEAIKELEEIVEKLEKGDLSLDESIEFFQKGIELSKYCSKRLDEIERKISLLVEDEKGRIIEEPFNVTEV